jgi:integrase
MLTLTQSVDSYLAVRRAAGFALKVEDYLLHSFAAFSDALGQHHICSETAIEWAGSVPSLHQRARRLGDVIRLARYLRADDPRHDLPPPVFGADHRPRPVPYILSEEDIRRLLQAASGLGQEDPFRGLMFSTFFALLACTGLRLSEALRLRYEDITCDGLVIQLSKFRKSRLVPLHQTAQAGLERYLQRRRSYSPFDDHLFVLSPGRPLGVGDAERAFRNLTEKLRLRPGPGLPKPTIHSLRHTFAVRALETCPDGRDRITRHMLALSTYLGHGKVAYTYWYLQATPELMWNIAESSQRYFTGGRP